MLWDQFKKTTERKSVNPGPGNWWYHHAPTTERERIRQHGLHPSVPNENPQWGELDPQPTGVYMFNSPARGFGTIINDDDARDTWRIPAQDLPVHPDPLIDDAVYTQDHIPTPELYRPYEKGNEYTQKYDPPIKPIDDWVAHQDRQEMGLPNDKDWESYGIGQPTKSSWQTLGHVAALGLPAVVKGKGTSLLKELGVPPTTDWENRSAFLYYPERDTVVLGQPGQHHNDLLGDYENLSDHYEPYAGQIWHRPGETPTFEHFEEWDPSRVHQVLQRYYPGVQMISGGEGGRTLQANWMNEQEGWDTPPVHYPEWTPWTRPADVHTYLRQEGLNDMEITEWIVAQQQQMRMRDSVPPMNMVGAVLPEGIPIYEHGCGQAFLNNGWTGWTPFNLTSGGQIEYGYRGHECPGCGDHLHEDPPLPVGVAPRMGSQLPSQDGYYYHQAPTVDRDRIRQHGLIPARPHIHEQWENAPGLKHMQQLNDKGVYVTPQPAGASSIFDWQKPMDTWRIPADQVRWVTRDKAYEGGGIIHEPVQPELHTPYETTQRVHDDWFNPDPTWGSLAYNNEMGEYYRNQFDDNNWRIGLPTSVNRPNSEAIISATSPKPWEAKMYHGQPNGRGILGPVRTPFWTTSHEPEAVALAGGEGFEGNVHPVGVRFQHPAHFFANVNWDPQSLEAAQQLGHDGAVVHWPGDEVSPGRTWAIALDSGAVVPGHLKDSVTD